MSAHARGAGLRVARAGAAAALEALATLLGVVALVHLLFAAQAGDAADLVAGDRAAVARVWGLDAPVGVRVARAWLAVLSGDLGESWILRPGAPVAPWVLSEGASTLARVTAGVALAALGGLAAALAPSGARPLVTAARAFSSIPAFLGALLLVTCLNALAWEGVRRGWYERPAWFALPDTPSALREVLGLFLIAWAGGGLAEAQHRIGAALDHLRGATFLEALRIRGAPLWPRYVHHLAAPLAAALAARVPWAIGAAVVVERALLLPGAGALAWSGAIARDVPVAAGVAVWSAALVAGGRAAAAVVRAAVDPRPERRP